MVARQYLAASIEIGLALGIALGIGMAEMVRNIADETAAALREFDRAYGEEVRQRSGNPAPAAG